jgi:hypothetical protein
MSVFGHRAEKFLDRTHALAACGCLGAIPICVFETKDAAFAARIADAMGKAAKANSGQRLR